MRCDALANLALRDTPSTQTPISNMKLLRWALPLAVLVLIGASGHALYEGVSSWFRRVPPTITPRGPDERPTVYKAGVLEVTTIKSPRETFERTDPLTFWGIDLGTTVSQIRVDAVFRYQVPLDPKGWHIKLVDDQFRVIVPAVKPSLPVAFDSATLEKKTGSGWLRFNKEASLAALEKSLTAELGKRAASPSYIDMQRATARQEAAKFVTNWMIKQEAWKSVKPSQVRVFFSDEPIQSLDSVSTNF